MAIGATRLDQRIDPQVITKDIFTTQRILKTQQTEIKALKKTGQYSLAGLSQITKIASDIICIVRVTTEDREYLANALKNSLENKVTFSNALSFPTSRDVIGARRQVKNEQEEGRRKAFLMDEDDKIKVGAQLATLCEASCRLEKKIDRTCEKLLACYHMFKTQDPDNDAFALPARHLTNVMYLLEKMKKVSVEEFVLFHSPIRQPYTPLDIRIDFEAAEREAAAEKKAAAEATSAYGPAKRKLFRTPEETAQHIKAQEAKDLAAELEAKALAAELDALASEARKNQNQAQPQVEESLPVQQTQAVTEDSQPVQAPMQQVKLTCDAGWERFVGICCASCDWDKNPITLSNEGTLWFGKVSVGDDWKYVILNKEGRVIQWETVQTPSGNRKVDTLQEAAIDYSGEVQF